MTQSIERVTLADGLNVPRILTGLWQVADLERGGTLLDPDRASDALVSYAQAGFDGFDMADHYGSAEVISGHARQKLGPDGSARFFTKWCPSPDQWRKQDVRSGIQDRLDRLQTDCIDLLQLHWWCFEHPGWIDVMDELSVMKQEGKIRAIGVTNFDADHLHVLLSEGYDIATNQVSFSVIDRRAAGDLAVVCRDGGVKVLAYGTLAGGFLTSKWLGAEDPSQIDDWSRMKYRRFIQVAGGWDVFQSLLSCLDRIAKRHDVSIPNVATRYVLEQDFVGCTIVGARVTEREHSADTRAAFSFSLTKDDHGELQEAFEKMRAIPGDCGQEYRKPPFLTAAGDLSDHLSAMPRVYEPVQTRPNRWKVSSGSIWEDICGFSRAVRIGDRILVSGSTATHGSDRGIAAGDVRGQTVFILDKISAAVQALGGQMEDVVRTRVYLKDAANWEAASRVHGRYFAGIDPANTLFEIGDLIGEYDIEIEAEAIAQQPLQ